MDVENTTRRDAEQRVLLAALNVLVAEHQSLDSGMDDDAMVAQDTFELAAADALLDACRAYVAAADDDLK